MRTSSFKPINMRIALAQVPCHLGEKERNLKSMERIVGDNEADLFVFAETFLTGYMVRDRFFNLAETSDGESITKVASIAEENDCHILFGAPMWDEHIPGILRNSALSISPNGELQRYDKLFLANFGPFEEKIYFEQGASPSMFEIGGMKFGVCICYDLFFPELAKYYAMNGADALICISAAPNTSRSLFERIIPARAVEDTIFSIYVNQVGSQLNQIFHGGSQAFSPRGTEMARCDYYNEDLKVIDVDRKELEIARKIRPTLRNTQASSWCSDLWTRLGAE
jgi:predicted amidohydrolase